MKHSHIYFSRFFSNRKNSSKIYSKVQKYLVPFLIILTGIMLMMCARTRNPNINRGADYHFKKGFPEMRIIAQGLFDEEGDPGINITGDIVYGSLIFKSKEGVHTSKVDVEIKVTGTEEGSRVVETKLYNFTIQDTNAAIVNSQETFSFDKRIEVSPGTYELIVTITDKHSDKQITRTKKVTVPSPEGERPNITTIQMLGKNTKNKNRFNPVTTYTVPGAQDSLKFVFQVTHHDADEELTIQTRLFRFRSDTTSARPMSFNNYSPGSIQYKGIDMDERSVIRTNRRVLTETGNVLIEFKFPVPERGNYRFKVQVKEREDELYKARDFGVKSKNYPDVQTPRELARPLIYLMEEEKYNKMMKLSSPDSIKRAVDRFWLSNVGSKRQAREVIAKYYDRVVEANKQFSNFKEGWKTDMGYIYILFGPPWYVEESLDEMRWSYSYNRQNPRYNYYFFRPKMQSEFYPFQHYILRRHQYYYNVEYQQRNLWLNGNILKRNL